jgi:hypothetical protein
MEQDMKKVTTKKVTTKKTKKQVVSKNTRGLGKSIQGKNKHWMVETDYHNKLDKDTQAYLAKYNRESMGDIKKGDASALHNTDELRKAAYRDNNAVNRDLYSILATGNSSLFNSTNFEDMEEFERVLESGMAYDPWDEVDEALDSSINDYFIKKGV